jgi:uncharacterized protein (DUF1778 family)
MCSDRDIGKNEDRIRIRPGDPEADAVFPEESITVLSDRDRDRFLELLENPPMPNPALRKLFADHRQQGN